MQIKSNASIKLSIILSFLFLNACATVKHQIPNDELQIKVSKLTEVISNLSPSVNSAEAKKVAKIAVYYPLQLTDEYKLVDSPLVHNMMVNHGLRERGLCIHWTEDLLRQLTKLKAQTLKFYWGVAHRETTFRLEHSAVIVSPTELGFEQGIVLDGWRDSGVLFYSPVIKDKYPWKKHYNDITAELLLTE